MDRRCVKNLVFEGGGVKALAFVGALKRLEEEPELITNTLTGFAGSSAGALTATLVACGYTASDIEPLLLETDFKDQIDGNYINNVYTTGLVRLWSKYGLFPTDKLVTWLDRLIAAKLDNKPQATFHDLYEKTQHQLVITTTSVKHAKTLYYSKDTTPNMVISEAVKRSISIPLFFEANFTQDGDVLVDGGMLSNYPLWVFDSEKDRPNPETLGLKLVEISDQQKEKKQQQHVDEELKVDNLTDYMISLIDCLLIQIEKLHVRSDDWKRTIPICIGHDVRSTDFGLSTERKKQLIQQGYECTDKWLLKMIHL